MPNSQLLFYHLCFGAKLLQGSSLTTEVFILAFWVGWGAVAMATGLDKNNAKKCFLFISKIPVVRLFSSFTDLKLTLNPFCQQCSYKILT